MSFYDKDIKKAVAALPAKDRLAMIESLFNGMVSTLTNYYHVLGHSDREIQMLLNREISGVKKLITDRVEEVLEDDLAERSGVETSKNPCVEIYEETLELEDELKNAPEPVLEFNSLFGNQFQNDATIDLGLILDQFGVQDKQ